MKLTSRFTPFQLARIKLTGYYMFSITVIIVIFSVLTLNAKESSFIQVRNAVGQVVQGEGAVSQFQRAFDQSNQSFRNRLIVADGILLLLAAVLSWWMSGKTLTPVKKVLDAQKEFAADVSHELRTPLANIKLEIETTRRLVKVPKSIDSLLTSISEETTRMTHMVQGLLLLVRSNQMTDEQNFSQVNLASLIRKAVSVMNPLATESHITINQKITKNATSLGDTDQLLQVLLILIDNAIKYSAPKSTITLSLSADNSGNLIKVIDQGQGIPEADQKAIFDRFYRAKSLGENKIQGTGLGLAIAHRIVTSHQGTLSLSSKKDLGTTFSIRLPAFS